MAIRDIGGQLGIAKSQAGRYCEGVTVEQKAKEEEANQHSRPVHKVRSEVRRFLTFDGESIGPDYVLLGSDEDYTYAPEGLSTTDCLRFLTRDLDGNPIRTVFGLAFDVNHWVRDLPRARLRELFSGWEVDYGEYTIEYLAGHILYISRNGRRWTYYETRGYVEGSLEDACRRYLGTIRNGAEGAGLQFQSRPSGFSEQELRAFNLSQCVTHSQLMTHIRDAVTFPGDDTIPAIKPVHWHGPGAIASATLQASKIGDLRSEYDKTPPEVKEAIRHAYYGGRSEQLRLGTVPNVHAYDIRSAYPWAMGMLPEFTHRWRKVKRFWGQLSGHFSVWHVTWDVDANGYPGPLPWRTKNGYIVYPSQGSGWYWGREICAAIDLWGWQPFEISEGYEMEAMPESPLVSIVRAMYAKRQELKSAGDPRELGLKLGMNALYGKFCQARGKSRHFNLAYAGWITAQVRARLLAAAAQAPENVVAFNTDSILSDVPLDLQEGDGLGEWEHRYSPEGLFLQPGVYRLDGVESKSRRGGFKLDSFPWGDVLDQLTTRGKAKVHVNVFVTHMLARRRGYRDRALEIIPASEGSDLTLKTIAPFTSIKRDFILPRRKPYATRLSDVQYYSTMPSTHPFEDDPYAGGESYRSDVFASDTDYVFEDGANALE